MALTSPEKNKIVQLLGYGGKILQPGSVIFNKILNDRLDQLPVDTEDLVRSYYLCSIQKIETQVYSAPTRLMAKKVGDIDINNRELEQLRGERKKLIREMAQHLDIPYVGISNNVNVCV